MKWLPWQELNSSAPSASAPGVQSWRSECGVALVLTVAVLLFVGWFSFTEFKIGTYLTETDFYWSYWPKAEKITQGAMIWGDFRPPFYPMILAATHLLVTDYYRAGMTLSLLSALVTGLCCYLLFRRYWGHGFALAALGLLLVHPEFTRHAYCPGTDMFFFALSAGAVLAAVSLRNFWAGVLIGLAFMTRYNGIFLLVPALWFSPHRSRMLLGFGIVAGAFAVLSYHLTGEIYPNRNYLNVAFMLFGEHRLTWDQFWYETSDAQYSSLMQVLMIDPLHSVWSILKNVGLHLWEDFERLALWPVAALALLGFVRVRKSSGIRVLLTYGLSLFLILCLVFYSERFSLFLLIIYIPLSLQGLLWLFDRYSIWRSART